MTDGAKLGLLEARAEELSAQLHSLAARGEKVSDAALVTPMLISIAISAKRQADAFQRIADAISGTDQSTGIHEAILQIADTWSKSHGQ